MYDTIIIGAGMSGLAAGIRLAHFDQRVCILERHWTIGGLNSFYRMRGRDYDVGLHAVTNYAERGAKRGPLAKLLRQLRLRWEDFSLSPQAGSAVRFPGVELLFGNDPKLLEAEIAEHFPKQIDGYRRLVSRLLDYDDMEASEMFGRSARDVIGEEINDPLLIEMLLCPLMWYGNARERDMDFGQFSIMFRACYLEGFGRPFKGVRLILKHLVRQFRGLGGELKLRSGVSRIKVDGDRAVGVTLDDGTELSAQRILSSAGTAETMRLCDDLTNEQPAVAGKLSFIESISVLDCQPKQLGLDKTIVFFNDAPTFHWERPKNRCVISAPVWFVRPTITYTPRANNFPMASSGLRRWPITIAGVICPRKTISPRRSIKVNWRLIPRSDSSPSFATMWLIATCLRLRRSVDLPGTITARFTELRKNG